jgi:hypothetical protein
MQWLTIPLRPIARTIGLPTLATMVASLFAWHGTVLALTVFRMAVVVEGKRYVGASMSARADFLDSQRRTAAFRTSQQLARQHQSRQGPPSLVAHQAEIRKQDLLG